MRSWNEVLGNNDTTNKEVTGMKVLYKDEDGWLATAIFNDAACCTNVKELLSEEEYNRLNNKEFALVLTQADADYYLLVTDITIDTSNLIVTELYNTGKCDLTKYNVIAFPEVDK